MGARPLHIPDGINFNCSGCGNCCLHWPVPVTDDDVRRIPGGTFRRLADPGENMSVFTHTLEKRPDGRCTFLLDDNRCKLHAEGGIEAKPAMCQLFPYSFTQTPSGTYLYVSFASTGVLKNLGAPLTEQREAMEAQQALFMSLFPKLDDDWSSAQLIDGVPLEWSHYLTIEKELFAALQNRSVMDGLLECSRIICTHFPADLSAERMPPVEASPKEVDVIILNTLSQLYFPEDVFSENSFDLDARAVMMSLVKPPAQGTISGGINPKTMLNVTLGTLPDGCEQLLYRFVYSRIFGKQFFGRSYGHLSLLSGIHHLFFFVALIRLQAKKRSLQGHSYTFWDIAEILRTGERRITQMRLSRESCTVLEILLASPSRLQRVKSLAL